MTTKFWKPIQWLEANQTPRIFLVSLHPRPPVAYNFCVSVFCKHIQDRPKNIATDWWDLHMQIH